MTNDEIKMLLMSRLEKKAGMDKEAGPFSPRYIKQYKEGVRQAAISAAEAAQPLLSRLKNFFTGTKTHIDIPVTSKTVVDNDLIKSVAAQRKADAANSYYRAQNSIMASPLYYRSKTAVYPSSTHRAYIDAINGRLDDIPEALTNAQIPHNDYRNFQKLLAADNARKTANRMQAIPEAYRPNTSSVFNSVKDASMALNKHLKYRKNNYVK